MASTARQVAGGVGIVLALAGGLAVLFEGHRDMPYADPVGVLTVCYGHTGGIEQRRYTDAECRNLLTKDMATANAAVNRCITAAKSMVQEAALTDAAYSVGPAIVCGSTLQRLANAGDWPGACAQLSRWVNAGGKTLPGLVKRREAERTLCEGK